MERPEPENAERRRRRPPTNREMVSCPPRRMLALPPIAEAPAGEAKLAAVAVDLNVRLRSADMPSVMQERALRSARSLLDSDQGKRPNSTHIAMLLKKEFDAMYGPAWHCIIGKSFGSFVTHSAGGFLYFSVDKFSFLLFKTEVRPVIKNPPLLKLKA